VLLLLLLLVVVQHLHRRVHLSFLHSRSTVVTNLQRLMTADVNTHTKYHCTESP
jgi:hypothetical protein